MIPCNGIRILPSNRMVNGGLPKATLRERSEARSESPQRATRRNGGDLWEPPNAAVRGVRAA